MTMTSLELLAWPRDVRLALHPDGDYVSDVIRRTGDFFEADILDELVQRVTGGLIVDAGAMIGNHTAFLASFVAHDAIHAFEPLPANLDLLRRNAKPFPEVVVHDVALSDWARRVRMSVGENQGHAMLDPAGPLEVEARTLDSYCLRGVSLLKIDVEGHEPEVLAGALATIARCRPLILLEDWTGTYGSLLPDYRLVAEWARSHQTYLYEPIW